MNYQAILDDLRHWSAITSKAIPSETEILERMHDLPRISLRHITSIALGIDGWSPDEVLDGLGKFVANDFGKEPGANVIVWRRTEDGLIYDEMACSYVRFETDHEWAVRVAKDIMRVRKKVKAAPSHNAMTL